MSQQLDHESTFVFVVRWCLVEIVSLQSSHFHSPPQFNSLAHQPTARHSDCLAGKDSTMKRCLTLGISLCLLGLLSGCCCGQRCGFGRCGGGCSTGYAPSSCSPCGQSFGGFAPLGGGCSSCGPGGVGGYGGTPAYGVPGPGYGPATYLEPNGFNTTAVTNGNGLESAALPPASGMPTTAYVQPESNQTIYGQPAYGQPRTGQQATFGAAPVTTALVKPESLATY